ncbi:cell division protein PerM [Agromyces sp. SYSU T0242]|uniref:cell division protein PerM n=1 Tax=Agromyces litoreus TaxID=3158561 RepID=UPI003391DDF7
MRRTTIALLAALEATVAVLVGYGIAVVPLMLLWAVQFGLAVPVDAFFRGAADGWLLGHGVDIVVRLDPTTAAGIGIEGADEPFTLGIALLGFAALTFLFGLRIGRRATASGTPIVGAASAVVVTAALGGLTAVLADAPEARPVVWQAVVLPGAVMAAGVLAGVMVSFGRRGWATDATTSAVRRRMDAFPLVAIAGARTAVRVGVGSAVGVVAVAAAIVAVRIVLDHATIIGLYQALGAGVGGGITITLVELLLLPNVVIWTASWMMGPGFALGTGTIVSPNVTLLGPVPGLPLLGGLPAEGAPLGVLWLGLPVLLGFAGAVLVARTKPERADEPWWATLAVGAASGLVAGLVLGALAWASGGAAGPGRLADVGPDALLVGGAAAAAVGVGAIAGAFAARSRGRHGHADPDGIDPWARADAGDDGSDQLDDRRGDRPSATDADSEATLELPIRRGSDR